MSNIYLSPHFALSEFTKSATAMKHGIKNTPPQEAVDNLKALCQGCLEPLREALGLPVVITSGYRTKALNSMLAHSSERSQHMLGQAADFAVQDGQSPSSKFKVQGSKNLKHETGVSPMKLETDASPMEPGTGDSPMKLETGDSPMKLETPRQKLIRAFRLIILDESIDYDQLILYPSFIHVSYVSRERNRRRLTKANGQGSFCALSRAQALALN